MDISSCHYRAESQNIVDNVKTKAQDRQIVYNHLKSKKNGIFLNYNLYINNR